MYGTPTNPLLYMSAPILQSHKFGSVVQYIVYRTEFVIIAFISS